MESKVSLTAAWSLYTISQVKFPPIFGMSLTCWKFSILSLYFSNCGIFIFSLFDKDRYSFLIDADWFGYMSKFISFLYLGNLGHPLYFSLCFE